MAGRPKRVFTDDEVEQIESFALNGSKGQTIATALDIPVNSLKRHFGRKMQIMRAKGKIELMANLKQQTKTNPQTAIFMGKNMLGLVDKQVVTTEPLSTNEGTPAEQAAAKAAADAYKAAMARSALKLRIGR